MPEQKRGKGTKLTLKTVKKEIRITLDGWRRLTLSNMGITVFPKCLLKLTNVDELDLSRNQIQKLPDDIGNLSSLRWLDLHSNKLESVPESIGNMVVLIHLNLSNNRLSSSGLPSTLGSLTNLRSLNLGLNKLDSLPPTMKALDSLQELSLFDNLFTSTPEFVKDLHNLKKVNTTGNPLPCVQRDSKRVQKENMYLVHESSLCDTCLKRCKEQMERPERGRGGGGGGGDGAPEGKRKRTYEGLMVPNSVAAVNQDLWRIRKVEHHITNVISAKH